MTSIAALRNALLAGALLWASSSAHAQSTSGAGLRLLDSSNLLTHQPGALGLLSGMEGSVAFSNRLDPKHPDQSWDMRAAVGREGLGGGLLLRQDDQLRWWSGYGIGIGTSDASVGVSAQESGLPFWSTEKESAASRVDMGVTVRPTAWLAAGYNLGRSTDATSTRADQQATLAVRSPAESWGVESSLLLDGAGSYAGIEGAVQARFGALDLTLSGSRGVDDAARLGLFARYALDGAEVAIGGSGGDGSPRLFESLAVRSTNRPGAELGKPALLAVRISGPLSGSPEGGLFSEARTPFEETLDDLARAADDPRVGGVYLVLQRCDGGIGQATELRLALEAIRAKGKRVVAYVEDAGLLDLYLAGAAEWVALSPTVQVLRTGVGGTQYYLADLLSNLGISAQFVRTGPHKSGPEVYLQNGPSDEARAQYEAYLKVVDEALARGIGRGDEQLIAQWRALAAKPPVTADALKATELAQAVLYDDEVEEAYKAAFGETLRVRETAPWRDEVLPWQPDGTVAVLHIEGEIVDSVAALDLLGGDGMASLASIVAAADALREDESVGGVILRVDSPGGSAWASDEMTHALQRLAAKKPMVVSMGSVAASGGYYVASLGVPIYALPTTVTGSIGVYAGSFSADRLFERVGVHPVRLSVGGAEDPLSLHTWSDDERAIVERSVAATYERFLTVVATSRKMETDRVRELAGGRIYGGEAALAAGLVDDLTGYAGARAYLLTTLGYDANATMTVHLPQQGPGLRLSAGLTAGASREGSASLVEALGLKRLVKAARPLLGRQAGAPMMHFDAGATGL